MAYGRVVVIASDVGAKSPTNAPGCPTATILKKDMPIKEQRRKSERVPSMRACPYELTKRMGADAVMLTAGHAYSINSSVEGMLLLLPETVSKRQVFEIQVSAEARKTKSTKLGEVCWTRSILVNARVCMYLVGIRFLFELPFPI